VKKRILHISKVTGISGSENHLRLLLSNLNKDKYLLGFAVLTDTRSPVNDYIDTLQVAGVDVTSFPIRFDIDPYCLWKLFRLIRRGSFDLVHTHLIHGDLYGTVAAKLAGVKRVISTKHGYDDYENTSRLYRLGGLAGLWTDQVILISHALKNKCHEAEGIPIGKMLTIHYGIDGEAFASLAGKSAVRKNLEIASNEILFSSVGRLIPVKGYNYLLEAFALASKRIKAKLIIVGDGPLKSSLHDKIEALSLQRKVFLLGHRRDVSEILAETDVFVLPTLGEGFGLVILEAMSHRLPIIATRVMSIPEIVIDDGTGLLVPGKDAVRLADAIVHLAINKDLRKRLGKSGWQRLRNKFSVTAMIAKTEAVYDQALKN
jgi:glycosyltransferase involved in cell wall biosynthesis